MKFRSPIIEHFKHPFEKQAEGNEKNPDGKTTAKIVPACTAEFSVDFFPKFPQI